MSDTAHPPTHPARRVAVLVADADRRGVVEAALAAAGMAVEPLPDAPGRDGTVTGTLIDAVVAVVPDVVVVASDLADHLVPTVESLAERAPVTRPLALVAPGDDGIVEQALAAGLAAVVPSGVDGPDLVDAVERTARGESPLTPTAAQAVLESYRALEREPDRLAVPAPSLSPTELEVLRRLAAGATAHEVAELHQVTPRMVLVSSAAALAKLQRAHHDDAHARRRD